MQLIHVETSRPYDIFMKRGCLDSIGIIAVNLLNLNIVDTEQDNQEKACSSQNANVQNQTFQNADLHSHALQNGDLHNPVPQNSNLQNSVRQNSTLHNKTSQNDASQNYALQYGTAGSGTTPVSHKNDSAAKALIVSDDNVYALYGERTGNSLENAGIKTDVFVFRHGEESKTLKTYSEILNRLCDNVMKRTDIIVALGGGVTGDLAGFAAASYLRGIRYIQIPTSLLAMVDSSVGGKTAVNLNNGKNQAGAFWQPSAVLIDPQLLNTLPAREFSGGMAEVVKCAVLGNGKLFEKLQMMKNGSAASNPLRAVMYRRKNTAAAAVTAGTDGKTGQPGGLSSFSNRELESMIGECIGIKRDLVVEDEYDFGNRRLLNLGHTFGHCAEVLSGYSLSHGEAVAMGLCAAANAACEKAGFSPDSCREIEEILEFFGLPTEMDFSLDAMLKAAGHDKKRSGNRISLVIPKEIGKCTVESVPFEDLGEWMTAGGIKNQP